MEYLKKSCVIILIVFGISLLSEASWGEKVYVTDILKISIRTGPGANNKILTYLTSGQAMDIIESQEEWSHVRIIGHKIDKLEGWVLSRYLIKRLPWNLQAKSLKNENSKIKEKLDRLEKEKKETATFEQDTYRDLKENIAALEKLQNEYETLRHESADYLKLKKAYKKMQPAFKINEETLKKLTQTNENLKKSQRNRWFATGALVLLCGLIIGLLIGRQQKKHKSLYY